MQSTIDEIVGNMSPQEATAFYRHAMDNPYMNSEHIKKNPELDPKKRLLESIRTPTKWEAGNKPVHKLDHMQAMVDMIDQLPHTHDRKEDLMNWRNHFSNVISESNKEAA